MSSLFFCFLLHSHHRSGQRKLVHPRGHHISMKAIIETPAERTALERRETLLNEYRKALREWSRARFRNQWNDQTPEVLASMNRITQLELMLRNLACQQYDFIAKH